MFSSIGLFTLILAGILFIAGFNMLKKTKDIKRGSCITLLFCSYFFIL